MFTPFAFLANAGLYPKATGGTITIDGNFIVHTFTASGELGFAVGGEIETLVVAGGGSGGGGGPQGAGGGGAGGVVYIPSYNIAAGNYTITIGQGGTEAGPNAPGNNGQDTTFGSIITAKGGGGGGEGDTGGGALPDGKDGGSGGGAGLSLVSGSETQSTVGGLSSTFGYGNDGGSYDNGWGSGGGGATQKGDDGVAFQAGNGGNGLEVSISGTPTYYGGGGGGGSSFAFGTFGAGGLGGGGDGAEDEDPTKNSTPGSPNTGGGGGGGSAARDAAGSAGGSGIVIVRYRYQ
jgi:hypothetical protein